ncbi:hypothetical protein HD554DRAFT_2040928 [Boletus coccyginus]|nr:hypothetical protein HD554DRAFT_2040928 [Boletus coccyginus]
MAMTDRKGCNKKEARLRVVGVAVVSSSLLDIIQICPLPQPNTELLQGIFDDVKKSFSAIQATHKHRDSPRVVALLRPLDLLETLMELLDIIIQQMGGNFRQAMDGLNCLNCLLQCEDTWQILIEKLGANPPNSDMSRLSRILEVDSMDYTQGWNYHEFPVGTLVVEILLALYNTGDLKQLDTRNALVQANLTGTLVHLNPNTHDSVDGQGCGVDPGQQILHNFFGLDRTKLSEPHRELIRELKMLFRRGVPSYARARLKGFRSLKTSYNILADLREKIKNYNITEIPNTKLGKEKLREIHMSLVCLDIFWFFDVGMEDSESRGDDSLCIDPDRPWHESITVLVEEISNESVALGMENFSLGA